MLTTPLRIFGVFGLTLNPLTLAKDFANAIGSALLGAIGKGASALVAALLGFINTTSDPSFSSGWWSSSGTALFERVLAVTGSLMALAFMCSIITALLSGDRSLLARAFLRLPVAALQIALVVTVTGALVAASDQVAAEIARGATTNLSRFVAVGMIASISGSGIVGFFCGGLVILAGLAVWAELLVRSALIYLTVLAAPLVFAAGVHPSVSGLKRRYIEGGLALITSKIVVALAFATGSAMLSGLTSSPSFSVAVGALLQALVVLGVAAFSPFILLRLFLGAEGIIAAEGLSRRPARSAVATAGMVQTAGGASTMLRGLGGEGPGTGGPGGASPTGGAPGTPPSGAPPSGPRPSSSGPSGSPSSGGGGPSSGNRANAAPTSRPGGPLTTNTDAPRNRRIAPRPSNALPHTNASEQNSAGPSSPRSARPAPSAPLPPAAATIPTTKTTRPTQ